jgi:hypothetical protein
MQERLNGTENWRSVDRKGPPREFVLVHSTAFRNLVSTCLTRTLACPYTQWSINDCRRILCNSHRRTSQGNTSHDLHRYQNCTNYLSLYEFFQFRDSGHAALQSQLSSLPPFGSVWEPVPHGARYRLVLTSRLGNNLNQMDGNVPIHQYPDYTISYIPDSEWSMRLVQLGTNEEYAARSNLLLYIRA